MSVSSGVDRKVWSPLSLRDPDPVTKDPSTATFPGDRRNRKRVAVHWPVRLFRRSGGKPIDSTTENLSSEGLYCVSRKAFKTSEGLRCEIVIPKATLGLDVPVVLECQVTVRRVERVESYFGLGCHIDDYSVSGLFTPTVVL